MVYMTGRGQGQSHWKLVLTQEKCGLQEHTQICKCILFSALRDTISNILAFRGGSNVENAGMDRDRPPLRWMVFEAGALGLLTAPFSRELLANEQIEIKESPAPFWWPLGLLFFRRLTYTRQEQGKQHTRK